MSTKTSFKRISLAVIVALGLSAFSIAPSANAAIDETFTLSASSATINVGETATVTVTNTFVSEATTDSTLVYVVASANAGGTVKSSLVLTDSANVKTNINAHPEQSASASTSEILVESTVVTAAAAYTKNVISVKFYQVATAGTYTYTFSARTAAGAIKKTAIYTLTVTAEDTTAVASKSLMYIQDSPLAIIGNPVLADSTLVKSAGAIATPVAAGYIVWQPRNASDTKTAVAGGAVTGTLTLNISGPGSLSKGLHSAVTSRVKSISLSLGETATIWSDGTPGTATLTGYIGATALTQAAKTMKFFGAATTFAVTVESATVVRGDTANGVITFTASDAAGNAVESAALQKNGFTNFYAISSDTNVINSDVVRTAGNNYTVCSYNTTRAKFVCNLGAVDSGTATITISDSPTASTVASSAVTLKVAGAAYAGTLSFGKSSFTAGEKATLTATVKDGAGNAVRDGVNSSQWSGLAFSTTAPTFVQSTGSDAAGGTFTDLITYLNGGGTYVSGVDTAVVYMPNASGTYTLIGKTSGATTDSVLLTFTVVNPAEEAALAASDAAAEAIDAANAAFDAANIAAEAADAATVAAEEARDAADAATAAVEELATQVATLMAALKAQITTLANTVAKIAKKVAKL